MPSPYLIFTSLLAVCFTLATWLHPRVLSRNGQHAQSDDGLASLLGDGRRLFANHFFTKADVYFHSGYYPSIFDQAQTNRTSGHLSGQEEHDEHDQPGEHAGEGKHEESEHEKEMDFLGQPKDWIDRFGRNFFTTEHTELEGGGEVREILPWLHLSAELDPEQVETYTVAAFWLRSRLGKVKDAEEFLRQGLRVNPQSFEILFELGRLYDENYHDSAHARNLWELAFRKWQEQEPKKEKPDLFQLEQITGHLARLEEREGNLNQALRYLEILKTASPGPEEIQKQIDELKQKLAASPGAK